MITFADQPWPVVVAVVTGLVGIALWVVAWFLPRGSLKQRRLSDFGSVLVFGGMLTRYAVTGGPRHALDWLLCVLAVAFLGFALWSLFKTQDRGPQ
jgi:hypothetical protein